jgi:hypothetical protein
MTMLVGQAPGSDGFRRVTCPRQDGTLAELTAQADDSARVVKWQTRWLQVPVLARACGFKSRLAHTEDFVPRPLGGLSFRLATPR